MNFLNVFEQRVGSLFGATAQGITAPFSFKKLAKKAAREMEAETFVVDGTDTAPGLYTILVANEDDIVMRPLYPQLTTEVAQFIEGQAQSKGYVFVGQPVVRFMADPSLKSGRFTVFAENVDALTLERIRKEEAQFLHGNLTSDGLGGAAAEQSFLAGAQPVVPVTPRAQAVARQESAAAMSYGQDAGLDVLPQDFDDDFPVIQSPGYEASYPAASAQGAAAGIAGGAAAGYAMAQSNTPQVPFLDEIGTPAAGTPAANAAMPAAAPAAAPQTVRVQQAAPAPVAMPITCLLIDRASGRTYTGNAPRTVIGRERNAGGIVLHDPNISRSHAELTFDGRAWTIRDLNSTNGTLVNDADIDTCVLRDGDLITLGLTNLEFREN